MDQMQIGLRASYGPRWSAYQNRPCASLIQMNSGAPLLTWSAWVPARRCSHQTTITKSAAPSHGLPHVLRRHRFHQANCTLSWLLVGAEGLAVVELQVDLRSKCCDVATGLWERVPEGAGPDSRVYPRPHALFMDDPWNVQCAPAALDIGHCNVPALLGQQCSENTASNTCSVAPWQAVDEGRLTCIHGVAQQRPYFFEVSVPRTTMGHTQVLQEGICEHHSSSGWWGFGHACNLKGNSLWKAMRRVPGWDSTQPQLAPCPVLVDEARALCCLAVDGRQPVELLVGPPSIQCLWNRKVLLLNFNFFFFRTGNQSWQWSRRWSWGCFGLLLWRCLGRWPLWGPRAPHWRPGRDSWLGRSLLRGFASRLGLSRSRTRPFARHLLHLDELLVVAFTGWMTSATNTSSFAQHSASMPTRTCLFLQVAISCLVGSANRRPVLHERAQHLPVEGCRHLRQATLSLGLLSLSSCFELEGLRQLETCLHFSLRQGSRPNNPGFLFQHLVNILACVLQGLVVGFCWDRFPWLIGQQLLHSQPDDVLGPQRMFVPGCTVVHRHRRLLRDLGAVCPVPEWTQLQGRQLPW